MNNLLMDETTLQQLRSLNAQYHNKGDQGSQSSRDGNKDYKKYVPPKTKESVDPSVRRIRNNEEMSVHSSLKLGSSLSQSEYEQIPENKP